MKIVVIGGTGLIGSKVVAKLREDGHEAVPAAPNTGVNTLTGEGLAEVLTGASVVVDVSNSPSLEEAAAVEFFEAATPNLLAAEEAAGVGHHVALSVVGVERGLDTGYFRAKVLQEGLIEKSSIPYSLVHATQFFEFVQPIADNAADGDTLRMPPVLFQPMASDDVARQVALAAVGTPTNGRIDVAGPERARMDEFYRDTREVRNDPREVVTDPQARYFGIELEEGTLVPAGEAALGEIRYADWAKDS
jgi:uncharacterized protein YbjT (DUF2867 family)